MKSGNAKVYLALQLLLLLMSFGGVCSKTAAQYPFLSWPFLFYYGLLLAILFVYAIGWQQIVKCIPLTTAYMNKAVSTVWALVWGALFFGEAITPGKVVAAGMMIAGVLLFTTADGKSKRESKGHDI